MNYLLTLVYVNIL